MILTHWKDRLKHNRSCREKAAVQCSDNVYEQIRVRIVRVVRESEADIPYAAAKLGLSEATVRKTAACETVEADLHRAGFWRFAKFSSHWRKIRQLTGFVKNL